MACTHVSMPAAACVDILHRFITTGVLSITGPVVPTTSPSMDILAPYNVERVFYFLTRDTAITTEWILQFVRTGSVTVPADVHARLAALGVRSGKQHCIHAVLRRAPIT